MSDLKVFILAGVLAMLCAGCPKDDQGSAASPPPKAVADPSKVVKITTPVPYGQHVECANILDPAVIGPIIGAAGAAQAAHIEDNNARPGAAPAKVGATWDVTVEQHTEIDDHAASVCRVKRGGKPPSVEEAKKMAGKHPESAILGIVPGDEICQITTYCWFPYSVDDAKKKCEHDKGNPMPAPFLGDFTCVEEVQAGETYRYVLTIQDPKTKCTIKINPGPGATDLALSTACGQAALTIDPAKNVPGPVVAPPTPAPTDPAPGPAAPAPAPAK